MVVLFLSIFINTIYAPIAIMLIYGRSSWTKKYVILSILEVIFTFVFISLYYICPIDSLSMAMYAIASIGEILILYKIFKQGNHDHMAFWIVMAIVISGFACSAISLLVIKSFFIESTDIDSAVLSCIIQVILYAVVLIFLKKKEFKNWFKDYNKKIVDVFVVYTYAVLIFINYGGDISEKLNLLLTPILLVVQLVFMAIGLYLERKTRQNLLKKKEEDNLKFYTQQLEESQKALRKFKHDYQNMLISVSLRGTDEETLKELEKYSKEKIGAKSLWKYNNLEKILNPEVKSLLINKLNTMFQEQIPYVFECPKEMRTVKGIGKFDLVRVIGISYDNAIEASKELKENSKEAEIRSLMYYEDDYFEYELKNRCDSKINIEKALQRGYTTKEGHQGLGMANIQEIADSYEGVTVNYKIENGWFVFTLMVEEV